MMNAECGMMNMKMRLRVFIHHSAFIIHHFFSILSILVNYFSHNTSGRGQSLCPYRIINRPLSISIV